MKQIIGTKDKGVSPVIATILMVAITVVLAATVYLMVSGYMTGPSHPPIAGSLFVSETSVPTKSTTGSYTLTLSMSTPASASPSAVNIAINGTIVAKGNLTAGTPISFKVDGLSGSITWHNLSGNGLVSSGDTFTLSFNGYTPSPTEPLTVTITMPSLATGSITTPPITS